MGAVNGTDNISHWALLQGMVHTIETGGNPLDFWSGEGSFGAATMRTYQPLAHALVAMLYFALGKTVPLMTVFLWVRYLAIVLLPLAFFIAAEMLELPPMTALVGAALAPLISTNAFYGLDYSSYVSTGRGLFPQSVAAILLLLAIGYGYRAVRYGRNWVIAGLFTGLTCICHFIYGWIAAVTICLMALLPDPLAGRAVRVRRVVAVGFVALAISAFQILPVLIDGPILNHSRWEGQWKWDSFGAATVMKYLVTGELLDHGRPPVLSLLALAGRRLDPVELLPFAQHEAGARPGAERRTVVAAGLLWTGHVGAAATAPGRDAGPALAPHHRGGPGLSGSPGGDWADRRHEPVIATRAHRGGAGGCGGSAGADAVRTLQVPGGQRVRRLPDRRGVRGGAEPGRACDRRCEAARRARVRGTRYHVGRAVRSRAGAVFRAAEHESGAADFGQL